MSRPAQPKLRFSYDIFISHNRADKDWARALANRLAEELLHGRPLRPWLDEKFLDPGDLASESELTIMSELSYGDHVVVDRDKVTLWPKTMVARTKDVAFS